jgi:hypothetical protein
MVGIISDKEKIEQILQIVEFELKLNREHLQRMQDTDPEGVKGSNMERWFEDVIHNLGIMRTILISNNLSRFDKEKIEKILKIVEIELESNERFLENARKMGLKQGDNLELWFEEVIHNLGIMRTILKTPSREDTGLDD